MLRESCLEHVPVLQELCDVDGAADGSADGAAVGNGEGVADGVAEGTDKVEQTNVTPKA